VAEELEFATLRVVEGRVSGPSELAFDFNPGEYSISRSSAWTRPQMRGGRQTGKPEFQGANAQTLQFEALFDKSLIFDRSQRSPGVADAVATLFEWVKATEDSVAKKKPQPPILVFEWGKNPALTNFRGYLKQVQAKYLLFSPSGLPLRATASITMEEVPVPPKKTNPTSGSIHGRRSHLMLDGDSLASLAWREYDDPTLWRGIAAFNGIDDPLRVRAGASILVPTADEARRLADPEGRSRA
jgi:hypothetical protein